MSVQQFCLRWNNHQPNFISVCSSLLHNGTLVDVTLAAEGKQLQAHKIVLSACSSYFQTLFTTNPCQHPIVILKDVQYNDLKTMVDFMYYGEVNVSQEQLPHILKTAEMLKIKGLAEMPDAAASLTKSESKSSSDQTEQLPTGASAPESLWGGNSDSQFQHHHHHQFQQQQQQQQQQTHHSTQRRTPSPAIATASPANRRKRLRKSSNNGSSERNSEEQNIIESSSNINLSQINQMSYGNNVSNMPQHIHGKVIKESSSTDTETHPQDSSQESIDESSSHHMQQIKPEGDLSNVQQSMQLEISGSTQHSQSEHENSTVSGTQTQTSHTDKTPIGSKRNRFLFRQARIKRESDSIAQQPPESVECENVGSRHLLSVPYKMERHSSEPAPSIAPSSSRLLTAPSTTYLVKQHSHPVLPTHSPPGLGSILPAGFSLHRQISQPAMTVSTITPETTLSSSSTNLAQNIGGSHFISMTVKQENISETEKQNTPSNPSVILVSEALPVSEQISTIRVKSDELQRAVSSPQPSRELLLDSMRSSHCPLIRPGPSLGCNFCWNTIDAHGRILRRKTKYHCPECQTNLCIVPCFQEYHERQNSESSSAESTSILSNLGSKSFSASTGLKNYPKTG